MTTRAGKAGSNVSASVCEDSNFQAKAPAPDSLKDGEGK